MAGVAPNPGVTIGSGVYAGLSVGSGGVYGRVDAAPVVPQYDPLALFGSGEVGMLYDPQQVTSLWQDVAGTVPVTADGQLVARIDDRSGNGRHLTQGTAANQYKYRDDGLSKWLDSEGRACTYSTAYTLTGPLTYGFSAEITQSAAGGNLFDTGPSSTSDTVSVFTLWSTSSTEVRFSDRSAGTTTTRAVVGGANRHLSAVVRHPSSGSNTYLDYGRSAILDGTARLLSNTTSGSGFRLGPTREKAVRFCGMFVIQRVISDAERDAVGAYYASLGRLENLFIWTGDAQ